MNYNNKFTKNFQLKEKEFDNFARFSILQYYKQLYNAAIQEEFNIWMGYKKNQRRNSQCAKPYRNGYYSRELITTLGAIELQIPRDRKNAFHSSLISHYERRSFSLNELFYSIITKSLTYSEVSEILTEYLHPLNIKYSAQTISNFAKKLYNIDTQVHLDSHYLGVYLDATYVPIKINNKVQKVPICIAGGGREDGGE